MKNTQLSYILEALLQEHEKIFDEIRELIYCELSERHERIVSMKGDLEELIKKENAALAVYVCSAEKKVRDVFSEIETGIKNISSAIDTDAVREGQDWKKSIRMLGDAIKETLLREEEEIFKTLQREFSETEDVQKQAS